jgi:NAD(P)H-dependent flavin oxidoreductase YrpB (nitropropane dioxygenase family)
LPPLLQANAAQDIYTAAFMKGDGEHFPMLAGQSMGIIRDLPGAADVVRSVMNEAQRVVERLGGTE